MCTNIASDLSAQVVEGKQDRKEFQGMLQPPYKGSKAMLKVGNKWVVSRYVDEIQMVQRERDMREYLSGKYKWSRKEFDSVDWDLVGSVRGKYKLSMKRQSSKIMHDWLPIGHMQGHVTGCTQCPGCKHSKETIKHMLKCPNLAMQDKRKAVIRAVEGRIRKIKMPEHIKQCLMDIIKSQLIKGHKVHVPVGHSLKAAFMRQKKIGFDMMMRGFLVKDWRDMTKGSKTWNAKGKMNSLLRMLWEDIVLPMWEQRNKIQQSSKSLNKEA